MFDTQANVPREEIFARVARLQAALRKKRVDAALILQNTDLFYFSGTIQQSHLYIPAEGAPLLLVYKSFDRACSESPIEAISPLLSPSKLPARLNDHGIALPRSLGMELDVLPFNQYRRFRNYFPQATILDISPDIQVLRSVKSPYEIDMMTRAAHLSDEVAAHAATCIRAGMTELDLAGQVEAYARKLGHQGVVRMRMWGGDPFYGHLMAGPSAAVPGFLASPTGGSAPNPAVAQGAGFYRIRPREPILLDYVFALNGYISDHARIFALDGLPDDLMSAHAAMVNLQHQLQQAATPGTSAGALYDLGFALAAKYGYAENFMGVDSSRIRCIGHGVGLELDEIPVIAGGEALVLEPGMVVALEPKLIFPGKGVVGIENTHVVTTDGFRQLGQYPNTVTIV